MSLAEINSSNVYSFNQGPFQEFKKEIKNLSNFEMKNFLGQSVLDHVLRKDCEKDDIQHIYVYLKKAIQLNHLSLRDIRKIRKATKFLRVSNFTNPSEMKAFCKIEKKIKDFLASVPENDKSDNMRLYEKEAFFLEEEAPITAEELYEAAEYWGSSLEALEFYEEYKEISLPASVFFFIKNKPKAFVYEILPELSDEELSELVYFKDFEKFTNEISGDSNEFILLKLLIQQKCSFAVEEILGKIEVSEELANWLKNWQSAWNDFNSSLDELYKVETLIHEKMPDVDINTFFNRNSSNPFAVRPLLKNDSDLKKNGKERLRNLLDSLFRIHHESYTPPQGQEAPLKYKSIKLKNDETGNYDTYTFIRNREGRAKKYTVIRNNQSSTHGFLKSDHGARHRYFSSQWLSWFIRGDHFETCRRRFSSKEDDQFWNNWEIASPISEALYANRIRPLLKQTISYIIEKEKWSKPVLMDVCGGKGLLASSILEENPSIDYTLLEFNEISIEKAKNRLGAKANVVKTDVIYDATFFRDAEKKDAFELESVDIVVGCGALTASVFAMEEGRIALANISKYLKVNGYLLLSGKAPSLLTSDDFIEEGYEVLNAMLPRLESDKQNVQFYVLRKVKPFQAL